MDRYKAIRAGMQAGLQGKTGWGRNEVLMLLDSVLLDVAQEEVGSLQRAASAQLLSLMPEGRCGPDKRPVETPPFVPGPANPQVYGPIKRPVQTPSLAPGSVTPLDRRSTAVEDNPPWD